MDRGAWWATAPYTLWGLQRVGHFSHFPCYLVLLVIAVSDKTFLKQCVSSLELTLAFTLSREQLLSGKC